MDELAQLLGIDTRSASARVAADNMEADLDLVRELRNLRRRRGLSQADMAELVGVKSQSVISDFERLGADPHMSTVRRYASALGCRVKHTLEPADDDWHTLHVDVGISPDDDNDNDDVADHSVTHWARVRRA